MLNVFFSGGEIGRICCDTNDNTLFRKMKIKFIIRVPNAEIQAIPKKSKPSAG